MIAVCSQTSVKEFDLLQHITFKPSDTQCTYKQAYQGGKRMQQQENGPMKDQPFITIRKLAALDMVFHGPRLILAEFALAVGLGGGLGIWMLFFYFHAANHPLISLVVGLFFLCCGVNYVPLFFYAVNIMRHQSAKTEVAFELAHKEKYARIYSLRSLLLFVPLMVLILTIVQERTGKK
jgi:hypothetical protein